MRRVVALIVAIVTQQVFALTPAVLIGPELERHPVKIQSLDEGEINFFGRDRRLRVEPISRYVQIRFSGNDQDEAVRSEEGDVKWVIDLVDTQRLVVQWIGAGPQGQTVHLRHALLGDLRVRLDDISSITRGTMTRPKRRTARDVVVLANDDRVEGFIATVGASSIVVNPAQTDESVTLPIDRVAAMYLTNTARGHDPSAHRVLLNDGSRMFVSEPMMTDDQLLFTTALQTDEKVRRIALASVKRINIASALGRLIDLTELDHKVIAGGKVFTLPTPPRVRSDGVLFHAPVIVAYHLPEGAMHFAATAELSIDSRDPDRSLRWADFYVIIGVDDRVLVRQRISGQQTRALIRVPLHGRQMTVELDAGVNGPIMDRLFLRDAVLFVKGNSDRRGAERLE